MHLQLDTVVCDKTVRNIERLPVAFSIRAYLIEILYQSRPGA